MGEFPGTRQQAAATHRCPPGVTSRSSHATASQHRRQEGPSPGCLAVSRLLFVQGRAKGKSVVCGHVRQISGDGRACASAIFLLHRCEMAGAGNAEVIEDVGRSLCRRLMGLPWAFRGAVRSLPTTTQQQPVEMIPRQQQGEENGGQGERRTAGEH